MEKIVCIKSIKVFFKMAGGRMRSCIPLTLPPESAPGHKLQKPSKESGIFQSLGTKNRVKKGEP